MSLCARSLVGSALRALPRRAVRSSRDATPLGTSGGRRRVQGARAVRGVVSAASSGDADVASTRAVAPPWKEEVLESHSLLGNVCFVLCGPQGPQNVGSVARVMQNFGIYDLRITEPGPFVLAGGTREDVTPADGASSSGGVNSGATLGPDGLGSELPPALRPTRPDDAVDGNPADRSHVPRPALRRGVPLRVRRGLAPRRVQAMRHRARRHRRLHVRHGHHREAARERPASHRQGRSRDARAGSQAG